MAQIDGKDKKGQGVCGQEVRGFDPKRRVAFGLDMKSETASSVPCWDGDRKEVYEEGERKKKKKTKQKKKKRKRELSLKEILLCGWYAT